MATDKILDVLPQTDGKKLPDQHASSYNPKEVSFESTLLGHRSQRPSGIGTDVCSVSQIISTLLGVKTPNCRSPV